MCQTPVQILEVVVVPDQVTQVDDLIIRDDGSLQGSIQTDFGSFF